MTRLRPPDGLVYRAAEERDAPSLEAFSCSCGVEHEDDVERFVRRVSLERALAPESTYRMLVFYEEKRLIAVAGHRPELLLVDRGAEVFRGTPATRLEVMAIAREDQGRRLDDGRRLSQMVMETLIDDALGGATTAVMTAVVARENLRSIALSERHGLTSQIEHDAEHIRMSGFFTRSGDAD